MEIIWYVYSQFVKAAKTSWAVLVKSVLILLGGCAGAGHVHLLALKLNVLILNQVVWWLTGLEVIIWKNWSLAELDKNPAIQNNTHTLWCVSTQKKHLFMINDHFNIFGFFLKCYAFAVSFSTDLMVPHPDFSLFIFFLGYNWQM